jgi:hypothetical protein
MGVHFTRGPFVKCHGTSVIPESSDLVQVDGRKDTAFTQGTAIVRPELDNLKLKLIAGGVFSEI